MQIAITLDDVIRDVKPLWEEFIKENEKDENSEKWLDYQSLASPFPNAEDRINEWYDFEFKIRIISKSNSYVKKWLRSHFIPYDSIIESPQNGPEYWIDNNPEKCLIYAKFPNTRRVFCILRERPNIPIIDKLTIVSDWRDISLSSPKFSKN